MYPTPSKKPKSADDLGDDDEDTIYQTASKKPKSADDGDAMPSVHYAEQIALDGDDKDSITLKNEDDEDSDRLKNEEGEDCITQKADEDAIRLKSGLQSPREAWPHAKDSP
ncbi:hypothetical protein LTR65_009010 [Meristemomyces frigidus]